MRLITFSESFAKIGSPAVRVAFLAAVFFSLSFFAPNTVAQKAAKTPKATATATNRVRRYTIEQFMDTVRISGASFSFDEKQILFNNNKTGIFNVYTVAVSGGESAIDQLD